MKKSKGVELRSSNKHVKDSQAYAPAGRGSDSDKNKGIPIDNWNKSVEPHKAYENQYCAEMGKTEVKVHAAGISGKEGYGYLGHFANDEVLKAGHNTGLSMSPSMDMMKSLKDLQRGDSDQEGDDNPMEDRGDGIKSQDINDDQDVYDVRSLNASKVIRKGNAK